MKRVILVQRNCPTNGESKNIRKLMELQDLAISANYKVVGDVTQTRRPDRNYQIGRGKVEELASIREDLGADGIIFSNQLSATQIYHISETCKCEVIDKFQLILEIFARRATTKRAKLQVELAKLQYELPKAKAIVSLLKKEERPGFMGLGSYEDSYEQSIRSRIHRIQKELTSVQKDNESLRIKRHEHGFSIVALAGYTSAGKSTLFNALVDEDVHVADMLFTTLLPITRALNIHGRRVLLTDTVGFIEDLPHWMIDAFRSTLNEIFLADVILLVVDASESPDITEQKLVTSYDTLWGQIKGVPIITVLNKIDRITEDELKEQLENVGHLTPNPVAVSAKNGLGFKELKMEIYGHLPKWQHDTVSLPMSEYGMSIVSWLFDEGIVHNINYKDRIMVDFEARDEIILKARVIEKR
ncbi:MAG: GTPase HflX [Candidatus Methanogaster sp.]|uniref:GTPase HflX n=1 Tax=Candidatus Methanogaster sp. TaxID=3386292 RepID=A0AC61KZU9_9EURY|nr:MAG: GTPase HflX [ANME-2 cluster archaeon]